MNWRLIIFASSRFARPVVGTWTAWLAEPAWGMGRPSGPMDWTIDGVRSAGKVYIIFYNIYIY
jgi:hypothetical protein